MVDRFDSFTNMYQRLELSKWEIDFFAYYGGAMLRSILDAAHRLEITSLIFLLSQKLAIEIDNVLIVAEKCR